MDTLFNRAADLFHQVLEIPPEGRASYLAKACGDDPTLRREVESLLRSHEAATGFLDKPASVGAPDEDAGRPLSGQRVGAYRLEAEIARGGMGVVYRAKRDDDAFNRQVAVKLVRPGLDPALTLSRFEAERRILANLDHPNIARLLDGGSTDEGQPYFVMEYVEGEPLGEFCEKRGLALRERLRLFRTVCEAVHHAHRSLVVHRDIKPSNILVTEDGVPKLLDFGIAKVLEADAGAESAATMTAFPLLTPAYASPEQVLGRVITTATDVYSLGVVLCELLSGSLPFPISGKPTQEILRIILEQEPHRPSALAPRALRAALAGDLDNIVQMALRKEPERRYASAAQLAEDVDRYLGGEPLLARRPTFRYRAAKFVRRNRLGVAVVSLAVVGLVGGIVLATWQAHVAGRHRATAERRFSELRQVANFFLTEFHDKIRDLPGSTPARALLVKRMLAYLDELAREVGDDQVLQRELAAGYQQLGDVQGNPNAPSLGDTAGARRSYEKAEALRRALVRARPDDPALRRELAHTQTTVGYLLRMTRNYRAALARYRKASVLLEGLARAGLPDPKLDTERRTTYAAMGDVLLSLGETRDALETHRLGLAVSRRSLETRPDDSEARRNVAVASLKVGYALLRWGDAPRAVLRMRESLAQFAAIHARSPDSALTRRHLAVGQEALGVALYRSRRFDEALRYQQLALLSAERFVASDPKDAVARRDRLAGVFQVAEVLRDKGDPSGSMAQARRAVRYATAEAAADPTSAIARRDLLMAHLALGKALAAAKRWTEALASLRRAMSIVQRALASGAEKVEATEDLANTREEMGLALLATGNVEAARGLLRTVAAAREQRVASDPENAELRAALARAYANLGRAVAKSGIGPAPSSWRQASGWFRKSDRIWSALRQAGRLIPIEAPNAARARAGLRRVEAALRSRK